jgi:hypothetical protein
VTTVAIEFPTRREEVIHACKKEIRYRADYMHLNYDPGDIQPWDVSDGYTIVLLTHIYLPQIEDERIKEPTVYIVYPSPMMNCWEKTSDWKIEARTFLPTVRVRIPQLVLIIGPDDRVITSDPVHVLQLMACEDEKAMQGRIFDRWEKICFEYKAERLIAEGVERERENDCYS